MAQTKIRQEQINSTMLGYSALTTTQTGITTVTDLTNGSVTVTVPSAVGYLKISGVIQLTSTNTDDYIRIYMREGSTTLQTFAIAEGATSQIRTAYVEHIVANPTAGSRTFKLSIAKVLGTGSIGSYVDVSGGFSGYIKVEFYK